MCNCVISRSLEIPPNSSKIELKIRLTRHGVLYVLGNEKDNANADPNNVVFTIKDTKLFLVVVTILAKDNQILSKILSRWFERSLY